MSLDDPRYDQPVPSAVHAAFGLCGCGLPVEVADLYLGALRLLRERHQFWWGDLRHLAEHTSRWTEVNEALTPFRHLPEVERYALLYVLDAHGLTEHGGNVLGSWLTERGEQVLDLGERWQAGEDVLDAEVPGLWPPPD